MVKISSLLLTGLMAGLTLSTETLARDHNELPKGLYVSGSMICNDVTCYPKIFEPTDIWTEIKPGQQLPGGLDLRMNLETGLKEAKLANGDVDQIVPAIVETERDSKTMNHEFTKDFDFIRDLMQSDLTESQVKAIEAKLDDLMEFAHDYKHGFDIINHEFGLLRNISFSKRLPNTLRELGTRTIISCTRNNPRVVESVNVQHPHFVSEVFHEIEDLVAQGKLSAIDSVLTKRYLSLLDELITDVHTFTQYEIDILAKTCQIPDNQIKIEALEIISQLFANEGSTLKKRDLETVVPDVQLWVNNLQKMIQDENTDELHTRKFFNSLYNIKKEYSDAKVDSSFLNWLSKQTEERKKQLENNLQERDLEQDSFDKRMIESRHLVFGNPMANRIKMYNDEL